MSKKAPYLAIWGRARTEKLAEAGAPGALEELLSNDDPAGVR